MSDSESGNSRRASTENIVSGLEPMQSKKQFIPVILDVKTMPQHNVAISLLTICIVNEFQTAPSVDLN